MSPSASTGARARQAARGDRPELRLAHESARDRVTAGHREGDADVDPSSPRILIVARGAPERALVRRELADALAPDTVFVEADNVWEVLAQASTCGVVMLAGDLEDVSARTLMELLGRRHPWLPVLILDAPDGQAPAGPASA